MIVQVVLFAGEFYLNIDKVGLKRHLNLSSCYVKLWLHRSDHRELKNS